MADDLLRVERVSVVFGGLLALDDVSFAVPAGAIVALIGPNGSGKTTLFNAISGVSAPSRGRVWLQERDITGEACHRIVRAGIARTFQSPRVFPSINALGHVVAGARAGLDASSLRDVARQLGTPWVSHGGSAASTLARVALAGDELRSAAVLPYGKRRLLEMARCLATKPRLLLLDEPAAGLNDGETASLHEALVRVAREDGLSLLVIEHDMAFVRRLCPRTLVLDQGGLICDGPTAEVLADTRVKDAYLGDA